MVDHINKLIKKTREQYSDDYSYMLRDYNQENETVNGYNGRQLLELLQNCDDEGSKEVLIKLDQKNKQVSIHNIGSPFSKKGYRSLFISNLSSKTEQKKYIGNKGLGFRSIINWSHAIEIQSNNLSLSYSRKTRKDNFNSLFDRETQERIRSEENLKDDVIPLPFLTIPEVNSIQQNGYVTSIIIDYDLGFLEDIVKQIRAITPETILFLNSIEKLKFEGLKGKTDFSCTREKIDNGPNDFGPVTSIRFETGTNWHIFEKEKPLPEKYATSEKKSEEFYQIKIAVDESFEISSPYLYSFFPTRIQLKQPYILHATFDLDATRNQINDSDKNKFILEKIVKFTTKVATYFSKEEVSYKPLEILHHSHKADTLSDLGYYELITEAINSEAILPCIDNTFKCVDDSIFITNEFGKMLMDVEATNEINCHLLPLDDKNLSDYDLLGDIDDSLKVLKDVIKLINGISAKELSVDQRANFIFQIVKNCEFIKTDYENRITFLINDELRTIDEGEYIYTPVTKDNQLETPFYANIQFVNRILFEALLKIFGFYDDEKPNKSRFFYDQLKGYCNIHSYEPATLAQKIISESRTRLNEHPQLILETIKEMNRCLFHNFLQLNDGTKLPEAVRVPSINKIGKVKLADELVFSNDYPTGIITEIIFENIYKEADFISAPNDLGLIEEDTFKVEEYLKWIGLNEFARYETFTDEEEDLQDYRIFISERLGKVFDTRIDANVWTIKGLSSILEFISVEKLILWIHFDEKLRKQLNDSENEDSFQYFYRTWNPIYTKPSYIKCQIDKFSRYDYSDYLVDERYSWVNSFIVNYREQYFKDYEVSKSRINALLMLLGAKEEFTDLSIEKVTEIINKLPEKFPNGKKTQSIYKRALAHYKENEMSLEDDLILFADDGEGLKPFPQSEIYFSDNIKLPKQLMKDFPVFNFPARAGGSEAIQFFGINDLSDVQIELTSHKPLIELDNSFSDFLELLKPIILTFRINVIEENKLQKVQASICNKIKIILCSEIQYNIADTFYEVLDYEFIHHKDQTYYLKVNESDTLIGLKSNRAFTNSCANIVSLSFDVRGDRNEFRNLFSGTYDDILINIKVDFGEDTFNEARELLGLADYKQAFWQAVFISKGQNYQEHLDDLALEEYIRKGLNTEVDLSFLDYENVNNKNEIPKVQDFFEKINLELELFSRHYTYNISLKNIHFNVIKNFLLSKKPLLKSAIWNKLNVLDIEDQSQYLNEINQFEIYHDFASAASEKLEFQFNLNLELIFDQYVNNLYEDLDLSLEIDVSLLRDKNSELFNEEELHKINQSERLKSLLYFQGASETIKSEITEVAEEIDGEAANSEIVSVPENIDAIIVSSDLLRAKKRIIGRKKSVYGVFTPKETEGRKLKDMGNASEKFVFNYLKKNNYKDVDWVARDNEGLHCDIRYTDKNGTLKYIEVKTFDAGRFFLSRSEYEFGQSESDNYEIWLVRNKSEIIKIKDFYSNSKYNPITSEYEIYLEF